MPEAAPTTSLSSSRTLGFQASLVGLVARRQPPWNLHNPSIHPSFKLPLRNANGDHNLYVPEWQEALNNNRELHERFLELQQLQSFARMGVNAEEKAALDEIREGNMDMHLRMAQAQQAQHAIAQGDAGDPDPLVFPGQKVRELAAHRKIFADDERLARELVNRLGNLAQRRPHSCAKARRPDHDFAPLWRASSRGTRRSSGHCARRRLGW